MKRLISWLLALTLIFGLLPMSAFAVEVDVDGEYEEEVDFGDLLEPEIPEPQFFELTTNRQMIVIPAGGYAYGTVDITTGATYNVVAFSAVSGSPLLTTVATYVVPSTKEVCVLPEKAFFSILPASATITPARLSPAVTAFSSKVLPLASTTLP